MNSDDSDSAKVVIKHFFEQLSGPFFDFFRLWPGAVLHPLRVAEEIKSGSYPLERALKLTTVSFLASIAIIQFFYPIYESDHILFSLIVNIAPVINICLIVFALRYLLKTKKIQSNLSSDLSLICVAQAVSPPINMLASLYNPEFLDTAIIPVALFNIYLGLMAKVVYGISYKEGYRLACGSQFLVASPFILIAIALSFLA